MTSARDARLQERLRGSQRRAVKDFDFALSFPAAPAPAPSQSAPISRRTPQPELPPQATTRRTPGSRGRGRPSNNVSAEGSNKTVTHSASNANISAKRRRLDSDEAPSSSSRSTRSSQHSRRPDIYAVPEDDPPAADTTRGSIEEQTQEQRDEPIPIASYPRLRTTWTPSLPAPALEEITESPTDAPGSGRRARVETRENTTQSSQLQDVLHAETSTRLAPAEISQSTPAQSKLSSKRLRRTPTNQSELYSDLDELDELSPEQPMATRLHPPKDQDELSPEQAKRRDRRSRHADEIDELSPEQVNRRAGKLKLVVEDEEASMNSVDGSEEAEEIDDQEAAVVLKKNRGRRISRNLPAAESPDLDAVPEPTPPLARGKRAKTRQVSTPAKQRHPKMTTGGVGNKQSGKSLKRSSKPSQTQTKDPIPVTVHRLTKGLFYSEDERDADILNAEIPYAKRGGVNAIDVLSQVCWEIVEKTLANLDELRGNCEDPALRREYATKWRAVEAFGQELQTRLIEHTINLDNTLSLEKRVRDEQKKKFALREEILRIRGEREQVALRMDEIRAKHENETNSARERDGLNTNIHDIELAIELGKSQNPRSSNGSLEMSGIELLLKRVADQVSNKSDTGGMLSQIKEFNSFLERAALALEGKRS